MKNTFGILILLISILVTRTNNRYPFDFVFDQLESLLDPAEYFRINRKVILSFNAIQKSGIYFNSRIKVISPHLHADNSIGSLERVNDFKAWLGGSR